MVYDPEYTTGLYHREPETLWTRGVYAIQTMEQIHHEKIGGRFLQDLRGEVRKLFMHFPLSFCNKFYLHKIKNLLYWHSSV